MGWGVYREVDLIQVHSHLPFDLGPFLPEETLIWPPISPHNPVSQLYITGTSGFGGITALSFKNFYLYISENNPSSQLRNDGWFMVLKKSSFLLSSFLPSPSPVFWEGICRPGCLGIHTGPGWPQTSTCLCLPSAGNKSVCHCSHHHPA